MLNVCIYPASWVLFSPQSHQAGLAVLCAAALLSLSAAKLLLLTELAEAGCSWLWQQQTPLEGDITQKESKVQEGNSTFIG